MATLLSVLQRHATTPVYKNVGGGGGRQADPRQRRHGRNGGGGGAHVYFQGMRVKKITNS